MISYELGLGYCVPPPFLYFVQPSASLSLDKDNNYNEAARQSCSDYQSFLSLFFILSIFTNKILITVENMVDSITFSKLIVG